MVMLVNLKSILFSLKNIGKICIRTNLKVLKVYKLLSKKLVLNPDEIKCVLKNNEFKVKNTANISSKKRIPQPPF